MVGYGAVLIDQALRRFDEGFQFLDKALTGRKSLTQSLTVALVLVIRVQVFFWRASHVAKRISQSIENAVDS
jgi:hypothetical protein